MKTIFRLLLPIFLGSFLLHAQWVQTNGPYGGDVACLAVIDTNLFAGVNDSVFLSTDNGSSWTGVNSGLKKENPIQVLAVSGTNLFAGTHYGIFRSTDNGTTWTWLSYGWKHTSVRAFATIGTNLIAGTGGGGVRRSTDDGANWPYGGLSHVNVRSLVVYLTGTGDTNLFAGTNGSGVFRSINNDENWFSASTGLTYAGVLALADSPNGTGGTNLIAGTWGGIFISTNDGTSWTEASTGLTFTYVYCLATSPNGAGGTNLFAGTWDGVFLSTDNGKNWVPVNAGLTNADVLSLVVVGNNLFAGTNGGVWKRPLPEMITSVVGLSTELPRDFNLSQNYPNPFNPRTRIDYQVSQVANINISVYNSIGQFVVTLVDEVKSPGQYSISWNATSKNGLQVPSGIYIARMVSNNFLATRKLMLLK